jgi:hypothetical protein
MVATLLVQSGTSWDLRSLISYPISATFLILFWLFWLVIILVPFAKVLKRTGHPRRMVPRFHHPFRKSHRALGSCLQTLADKHTQLTKLVRLRRS